MKLYQCDRCGKQFTKNPLETEKVGDYKIYVIELAAIEKKTACETQLDLCEDCKKALKKFIKNKVEYEQ